MIEATLSHISGGTPATHRPGMVTFKFRFATWLTRLRFAIATHCRGFLQIHDFEDEALLVLDLQAIDSKG